MKDPHGTTVHFSCKSGQKAIPSGVPNRHSHHNNPRSSLTLYALPESAIQHNRRKDGIAVYKVNKVSFGMWRLWVVACDVVCGCFLFDKHALGFLSCFVLYSHHFTCIVLLFPSWSLFQLLYHHLLAPSIIALRSLLVCWPMISRQFTHLPPSHFCLGVFVFFVCVLCVTHCQHASNSSTYTTNTTWLIHRMESYNLAVCRLRPIDKRYWWRRKKSNFGGVYGNEVAGPCSVCIRLILHPSCRPVSSKMAARQ